MARSKSLPPDGYAKLYNSYILSGAMASLSHAEWKVLTCLMIRCVGKASCDASTETIMLDTGVSKSGVHRAISSLEHKGQLETMKKSGVVTEYLLINETRSNQCHGDTGVTKKPVSLRNQCHDETGVIETQDQCHGDTGGGVMVTPVPIYKDSKTKDSKTEDSGSPSMTLFSEEEIPAQEQKPKAKPARRTARDMNAETEEFNAWYAMYPKKVAKLDAVRAWNKLNPSPQLVALMMDALKRQCADWATKDPSFIPYPATWINKERWEDQIQTIQYKSAGPSSQDAALFAQIQSRAQRGAATNAQG